MGVSWIGRGVYDAVGNRWSDISTKSALREDDMEMAVRRTECLVYIYIWGLRGLRYDLLLGPPMVFGDVAI